jgi:hypothetical protein
MKDKAIHIRGIAAELFSHMPLDYPDTLQVLEHLRRLADWRECGATPLCGFSPQENIVPLENIVPFRPRALPPEAQS